MYQNHVEDGSASDAQEQVVLPLVGQDHKETGEKFRKPPRVREEMHVLKTVLDLGIRN